jgi:putative ABC transport system substrate-binding protein
VRRRDFIHFIASSAAAWPLAARAQQASRTYRIAYLALAGTNDATIVKERLKELGYEEGKNLIFDLRSAHGSLTPYPRSQLILLKPIRT